MARNDQVTRQWHLLRRLEGSPGLTLEELLRGLPADSPRHPRTIRRDLAALESAGFPLVTDRAGATTRWKLMDGFRHLPHVGFSPSELMALVFSRELLRPLEGTHIHAALDSALNKATAALPAPGQGFVAEMRSALSVRLGPHKTYRRQHQLIDRATRAVAERQTLRLRYFSASRRTTARRDVDPYHLWYGAGALYLLAFCHTRRDVRMFAVERIRALAPTGARFDRPAAFDVDAYVERALVVMRGRELAVELDFDAATAAWVRDRQWHPSQALTPRRGGRLRMALRVSDTQELVGWILGFGRGVRVVRPPELRARVRTEARRIAARA